MLLLVLSHTQMFKTACCHVTSSAGELCQQVIKQRANMKCSKMDIQVGGAHWRTESKKKTTHKDLKH